MWSRKMSRGTRYGLLLMFGLIITFGVSVINGGSVHARWDDASEDSGGSCFKFYYSEDKNKQGSSTNEVCQDSDGNLSVTTASGSPKFTVSGDEVCLTIPGKTSDSCKTLISSADGSRKFNEAFIKSIIQDACGGTKTCKWKGSDKKTHTYYVSVNEPVSNSFGGSGGNSGNGGGNGGAAGGSSSDSEDNEEQPTCMNSGAAQSLGWIVCPILNILSNAAGAAYSDYVEPALRVEPKLFSQDGGDPTRQAWGFFQGLANVLFIILLLVVIFSQLTGVGIDNYGIKKILPKLIVAAILINLSYLICIVCVDVSNIVGNGAKSIFDNLSTGRPVSINVGEDGGAIKLDGVLESAGKTTLTGVVVLVAVVAQIWSAVASEGLLGGIILPLVVVAVSVALAIFFLFLLLAARQAAVVVLTVISPLAFACYILPNTKKLFDRWLKLGWALLLVYPICGILVGGGDYISRLLLSAGAGGGGLAMAFMAMVIGIVPIFFIPSVLRSSLAAAGNIGAKISNIGNRVRGGATRGIKSNELYKRAQERGRENAARMMSGYGRDNKPKNVGRFGRFIRGGERGMTRARAQYREDLQKSGAREELMNDEVYGARLQADRAMRVEKGYKDQFANMSKDALIKEARSAGAWRKELGDDDADAKMRALITAMESNGLENDIFAMLEENDIGNRASVMQHLAQSKNKVLRAYGKTGSGLSYKQFMGEGGVGTDGKVHSMQSYINNKGLDFLDGLDDKALGAVRHYTTPERQLMSTEMLVEAAARMKGEDARAEINGMLANREGISVSGAQLANFGNSTMRTLGLNEESLRDGRAPKVDAKTLQNFRNAAADISNNADLSSKIGGDVHWFVSNQAHLGRAGVSPEGGTPIPVAEAGGAAAPEGGAPVRPVTATVETGGASSSDRGWSLVEPTTDFYLRGDSARSTTPATDSRGADLPRSEATPVVSPREDRPEPTISRGESAPAVDSVAPVSADSDEVLSIRDRLSPEVQEGWAPERPRESARPKASGDASRRSGNSEVPSDYAPSDPTSASGE